MSNEDDTLLISLHVAEYTALTSRATYWITLQFAVWPIAAVLVGLVYQLGRDPFHPQLTATVISFLALLSVQVNLCAYYVALNEVVSNARYIEQTLKPLVRQHIKKKTTLFWRYEQEINKKRGWPHAVFSDLVFAILSLLLNVAMIVRSHAATGTEYLVVGLSALTQIAVVILAFRALLCRLQINRHAVNG